MGQRQLYLHQVSVKRELGILGTLPSGLSLTGRTPVPQIRSCSQKQLVRYEVPNDRKQHPYSLANQLQGPTQVRAVATVVSQCLFASHSLTYRPPLLIRRENAFTDWLASHPRIVIPILAVLAGTLSYAIFDPIRSFFVKSKVSHLFDLDQYRAFRWLKKETVGRLGITSDLSFGFGLLNSKGSKQDGSEGPSGTGIEQERREAADKLSLWLKDLPDTFITVK